MKKFLSVILILIILFPMVFYLNPFMWGMRRMPEYRASVKTQKLFSDLDKKYNAEVRVDEVIDTLWYFRDVDNGKILKLENFKIHFSSLAVNDSTNVQAKEYVIDFISQFEHRKYFDSVIVRNSRNSIIYKTKMK